MGIELIDGYFSGLTELQKQRFALLQELYADWNAKINVISRQDMENLYLKHVLHSLAIAKVVTFKPNSVILDVGTGGGFPGIPLAILFPEVEFHLADSIGKKIKVVEGVAESLELKNVKAYHKRVEQLDIQFDFCVTRAVAPLTELVQWTRKNVAKNQFHDLRNGILCLKGGDLKQEIADARMPRTKTWAITDFFDDPFFETKKVVYASF